MDYTRLEYYIICFRFDIEGIKFRTLELTMTIF